MKELDEFKQVWQSQKDLPVNTEPTRKEELWEAIDQQRKRIFRANLLATIALSLTSCFLVWMIFNYRDESPVFYSSILLIILLMVVVIVLLWKRQFGKHQKLSMDSKSYLDYQIRKLEFGRKLITYYPLYGLLLGLLINAYAYSLIKHASGEFVFWMTNINWLYIILVSYFSYQYKMKRFKKNVEPIIQELQTLSKSFD